MRMNSKKLALSFVPLGLGLLVAVIGFATPTTVAAQTSNQKEPQPKPVSFKKQVRPILQKSCFSCHKKERSEGGVDLTNNAKIKAWQGDAKLIVPGKPEESLLIWSLEGSNKVTRMPYGKKPLPEKDQALIALWIKQGAKFD